ncbi:uncharacterized protein LOC111259328 isoform X1 [Varroa jacobsoni]|uniref:uncharacterized protein LOC111259328 isoform X1 n=1 Tax=Varroa jacobsoni TaxID=62625 RepID=UPI000BF77270|nr:uncharacterized protein LOC111259328 isoform X1 [Varroa jacobsoni]
MNALKIRDVLARLICYLLLKLLKLLHCDYLIKDDIHVFELVRILLCYIYFRYGRQSVFPTYNFCSPDPVRRGYVMRAEEQKLEYPVSHKDFENEGPQELLLTGTQTSGELLVIRMIRAGQRQAEIQIVLRDSKGRVFVSPHGAALHSSESSKTSINAYQALRLDISQGNKYQAGGLRLMCMEPMRKWRIAYNGMMIQAETGCAVYVSFVLLWFNFTHVMDWTSMVSINRLMKFCLQNGGPDDRLSDAIASIELCRKHLKGYEQSGYYVGTIKINENSSFHGGSAATTGQFEAGGENASFWEEKLHLRGNFIRIRHPQGLGVDRSGLKEISHQIAVSARGHIVQISTLNFSHISRNLAFGSFVGTSGFKDSLEHVLNQQNAEAKLEDVLTSPVLQLQTFELSHEFLRSEGASLQSFKSVLGWNNNLDVSAFDAMIDGINAVGITIRSITTGVSSVNLSQPPLNILDFETPSAEVPYVVSLFDSKCKNRDLTGGKGSSLAVLSELSHLTSNEAKFVVPNGVVVTTEAFRRFLLSPKVSALEKDLHKVLSTSTVEEVKLITDQCKQRVQNEPVPSCISKQIIDRLKEIFPDLPSKRFAIRSSCAGEDSEDMSAAGQMDTFLGVRGEKEIIAAIVKCWSSQFSHIAIEYKRRYGQELLSEMAVVVMEMVAADSAGVMLTCDPLTGDPSTIYITSNFGLGESVVSALADPDTVRVHRDISGKITVNQVDIGKKNVKIIMDEVGGTREEKLASSEEATDASISVHQAVELARVGTEVEKCYGDWRDVEWAFQGHTLFLLQARPITFMDKPSDEEISLDMEIPARNENTTISTANVGEVLNRAITPLGIDLVCKQCSISMKQYKAKSSRMRRAPLSPYFESILKVSHHHYFIDLIEWIRAFATNAKDIQIMEALMLNVRGRVPDDPLFYENIDDPSDLQPYVPYWERTADTIHMKYIAKLNWRYNYYLCHKRARFPMDNMSVEELLDGLIIALTTSIDCAVRPHVNASNGSLLWSNDIVNYIKSINDESTVTVYGYLSRLLGSAHDVVSCEVPKVLEKMSQVIQSEIGRDNFLNASNEEALTLLKNEMSYPLSSKALKKFLEDHGHRGYNEFDPYRKPWALNAVPVVATLQAMLKSESVGLRNKKIDSVWASIKNIPCKLTFWHKLRLSVLVYFARKGVGIRENTKSLWIWAQHVIRLWCWALGRKLKAEGRLPDEELLFFCTLSELHKVIKTRDSAIISRAYHRKRLFPELVKLQFPEYFRGDPKPIAQEVPTFDGDVVQMKGFPISVGRVEARARVINKIEEAHTIQRGEILITYATDIAWSPYFPLLGGIVTELGGLMSHAAVIAREYGLPCVVGLFNVTQVFRTGDLVLLDGANGLLVRIEEAKDQQNYAVPEPSTTATRFR